jgi:hypothetical protein
MVETQEYLYYQVHVKIWALGFCNRWFGLSVEEVGVEHYLKGEEDLICV